MQKSLLAILFSSSIFLVGCGQSAEEKIQSQISEKVHALTADERLMRDANAKSYFNKSFPVLNSETKQPDMVNGVFLECRPSDSNFNGLVSCSGQVPQPNGAWKETKRYCGYTKDLVGCSDEDSVR